MTHSKTQPTSPLTALPAINSDAGEKAKCQTINTWTIDYLPDSTTYYSAVRHLPNPIWLDSGRPHASFGRYDIISAAPSSSFSTVGAETTITHQADILSKRTDKSSKTTLSDSDPFLLIDSAIQQLGGCEDTSLPFTGGALGYLGYNLRGIVEPNLLPTKRDIEIPDMLIGIYKWAIIQDHHEEKSYLVTHNTLSDKTQKELLRIAIKRKKISSNNQTKSLKIKKIKSKVKVEKYKKTIAKIHNYIANGDCYQVNFAQRFEAKYKGDSFLAYQRLREQLPAPFGCYMEFEAGTILSHSPERFLKVSDRKVETKPIKGTIERGENTKEDIAKAVELLNSKKDRAENLMIVDLLRNDLSKSCELGSVETPELFVLESYANVHHLVSKVTGTLRSDSSLLDLFKGCFPGGSITGAPKFRSMEIIDELEPLERSIYCGSIGYISSNGEMDTNIAIRTIACDKNKMYCWGGGGIVADSEADKEYQESLQKVAILLKGLESFHKSAQKSNS